MTAEKQPKKTKTKQMEMKKSKVMKQSKVMSTNIMDTIIMRNLMDTVTFFLMNAEPTITTLSLTLIPMHFHSTKVTQSSPFNLKMFKD